MTTTWQLKCWNSMHINNNSVLHYLYNIAVGLVIHFKARAFKAKAKSSRPRPENPKAKAKKFGLNFLRPMLRINILYYSVPISQLGWLNLSHSP